MHVLLSDPLVMIDGWLPEMDVLGAYSLKVRPTQEEMRRAREIDRSMGRMSRGPKMNYIKKSCISHDKEVDGRAYILPGLWPRVKQWLDARGIEYEMTDQRNKSIRPDLDYGALAGISFRENQDMAVALIADSDCGIIATPTGFGKSFIIGVLCKVYPTLNILVTTRSKQVVETLYRYLNNQCPGEVGTLTGERDTTKGKRIILATLKSVDKVPPENVHLVLVDECHEIGDNTYGESVMRFAFARRFGFSASPVRNDGSALMMEAILGPVLMTMNYDAAVDAGMVTPMSYAFLPCSTSTARISDFMSDVQLKRAAYWTNETRSLVIADFVKRLIQTYDGQVLIMVSTLEHALNIAKYLPHFVIAYSASSELGDLKRKVKGINVERYRLNSKQMTIMRRAFEKGTLKHVISTKSWKQGVDFTHLSCLVRADADVSEIEGIQIPGRLSRLDEGKDIAYLIDVDDRFSDWSYRRAQQRKEQYNKNGWTETTPEEVINELSARIAESHTEASRESREQHSDDEAGRSSCDVDEA